MINKIVMSNVKSYKESSELYADKHTILIYGLNGTGKSTFSNYLYDISNPEYKDCLIDGLSENEDILVYNQHFINENFYETDTLKGIFTLSKENKKVKQAIDNANGELKEIDKEIKLKDKEIQELIEKFDKVREITENKLWEVKTQYAGGDRVLEYCLEGLKGKKSKLFDYIKEIDYPKEKPVQGINDIKAEVKSLGKAENKFSLFCKVNLNINTIENADIFNKVIVGNGDSIISNMINKLGNSDWVQSGLEYVQLDSKETQICPFCQSRTITTLLIDNIKGFFDETYKKDIEQVQDYLNQYENAFNIVRNLLWEQNEAISKEDILKLDSTHKNLLSLMQENIRLISEKIKLPSKIIDLKSTNEILGDLNKCIELINDKIEMYNNKIENKSKTLNDLKNKFWKNIRWEYDIVLKTFFDEQHQYEEEHKKLKESVAKLQSEWNKKKKFIENEQKKTVNIDEAISNINNGLIDLGIGEFKIAKVTDSEDLYKIVRGEEEVNIFKSLSEGEKMLISFLYFVELCRGKKNASDIDRKKIVVIDDPITSMSHVYIFNVGRMIHNEFLRGDKYEQIFILTHSLYFFYELTCLIKDDRDKLQKLVRINKDAKGSRFLDMHYQEIQNDYQAYWSIIKDSEQPPALIANCMRNIIEYFFNFVEKVELSNVFQKPSLQAVKYQAFYRYINRESHSLGQNIIDFKEFNYDDFKEAFRLVFVEAGYENHYKKMMKQKK